MGDTARSSNKCGELNLSVEEMKVVMSLCTILNARCNPFKGMQLLLSFMLIARGTSKQINQAQSTKPSACHKTQVNR